MRILHVSDLHVRVNWQEDQKRILNAFLADVAKIHEASPIDVVIVSGDLTFSATAEQFSLAEEMLLNPLRDRLEIPRSKIVLASGNHDVDISGIDEFGEAGLRQKLVDNESVNALFDDPDKLRQHTGRLDLWRAFHERFYEDEPPELPDSLSAVHRFSVDGTSLGIISLASSWRATGAPNDGDKGNLLVGDRQISRAHESIRDADLKIAVMHHPLDWVASFDERTVNRELHRHIDILCTGHMHQNDPYSTKGRVGSLVHSVAGALYESPEYINSYTLIEVLPSENRATLHLRTYYSERGEFDSAVNLVENGQIDLPLRGREDGEVVHVSEHSLQDLAARAIATVVQETSILGYSSPELRSLDELLVQPVLLQVPMGQYLAVADAIESHRLPRVNFRQDVEDHSCIVVVAEESSGLTSALQWFCNEVFTQDHDYAPVVIDYSSIETGTSAVQRAVKKQLAAAGIPAGTTDPIPLLVLGVDNIVKGSEKKLRRLAKFIATSSQNRYILGCRPGHEYAIEAILRSENVDVVMRHLGPFGRRELKALLKAAGSESIEKVAEAILAFLAKENIPRSPFMMAALVSIMGHEDRWQSLGNETAVLEAYVGMLLGRGDTTEESRFSLDYRDRQHLLSSLAEHMTRGGIHEMRRIDVEQFLITYFRRLDWSEPTALVLESFINRRILREREKIVSFRHPAVQSLLAAQGFSDSPDFRTLVLGAPLEYSAIIRHAAALRRSDRGLLNSVGEEYLRLCPQEVDLFTSAFQANEQALESDTEKVIRELWEIPLPEEVDDASPAPGRFQPEHMDEMLDSFETMVSAAGMEEAGDPDEIEDEQSVRLAQFSDALTLLSAVLRNSELVQDLELKRELLRQLLQGYGTVAALSVADFAASPESSEALADLLGELVSNSGQREAMIEQAEILAPVLIGWLPMMATLSSNKLARALEDTLDDDEFMASPGQALMGALIAKWCDCRNWPVYLKTLLDRHGHMRVIRESVFWICSMVYLHLESTTYERSVLEPLMYRIITYGHQYTNNLERGHSRNVIIRNFKSTRSRIDSFRSKQRLTSPVQLVDVDSAVE